MVVCLTGFMGCGKSSIGRELGILLDWDFVDLDEAIVDKAGMPISQIFADQGEEGFRRSEVAQLRFLLENSTNPIYHDRDNMVIALGGGTIMQPEAQALVDEHALCIYLKASFDTLFHNLAGQADHRPMLSSPNGLKARIEELMAEREDTYESTADIVIDTDGLSPREAAEVIAEALEGYEKATGIPIRY